MSELYPESASENSNEADLTDQQVEIDEDPEFDIDRELADLEVDDADIGDLTDQHIPAELDDEE